MHNRGSITTYSELVPAGTTPVYTGLFFDGNGEPPKLSDLISVTLTILDTNTRAVVNGIEKVDILNVDRGRIDADGTMTITLKPADTQKLSRREREMRSDVSP